MYFQMIPAIRSVVEIFAVAATAYYVLCLWTARGYLRYRKAALGSVSLVGPSADRPVSILKPLKGADPEIYEAFRSHCLQEYRHFEIIFGVSEAEDSAVPFVLRLQQEFPEVSIQLVVCSEKLGANTKVSNLVHMLRVAQHDLVIVNDSDIRVERDYLRRVTRPLANPHVGMVTCLYRGIANHTVGSKLESIGISTDFAAGVLVARLIEGRIKFGLGSTLAFRRDDLEAIGGFEALVDHLADDYELGKRIAERGLEVRLSDVVVETFLPPYTLGGFCEHQLRWARTVRDARRAGYLGLLFTFGLPWALLTVIASLGALWSWALLGVTIFLRVLVAGIVGDRVLADRQTMRLLWLMPLRDFVAVGVWLGSFCGNTIWWRGDSFQLKNGKLIRLGPKA
jgi:ceramide glucosyltransferase